jgi:hypothetical protein
MEDYRYLLCPTSAMCLLLHLLPASSFFIMVCPYGGFIFCNGLVVGYLKIIESYECLPSVMPGILDL